MELEDGLKWYMEDSGFWEFTQELEVFAKKMSALIARGDKSPKALEFAHALLRAIELWKAGCIENLTGYAAENDPQVVWDAFRDAINAMKAKKDEEALKAIMRLIGFGSYEDPDWRRQRAKRASAVLRMFNPEDWGVVDWRTAIMIWALDKKKWNVAQAVTLAKDDSQRKKAAKEWDEIDENIAVMFNNRYRAKKSNSLQRTADVEMASFGTTFKAWPAKNLKSKRSVGETYTKTMRGKLQKLDKELPE